MFESNESTSKKYKALVKSSYPPIYRKWRWNNSSGKSDTSSIDLQRLEFQECPNCYSDFKVNKCQIRIKPKMKLTTSLKKLLKKSKLHNNKLSKKQQHLVDLYVNSKNNIILKCLTCSKTLQTPGVSRQDVLHQRSRITHNDSVQKITRTSNTDSCSKTTVSKSSINTKSLSKKKKQKMKNQSLQFILSQEKRRESGGSLKDFLSSVK